ncbi:MAG TPA: polyprenol monophosphomannose synthase, partial [Polyangiaceae bacterium]|nr:polyprenol monophosphomannose synthase [Polyangiaceae bacterium]
ERTLIVIPTFNEADNLKRLTAEIARALPDADQLVVDDASADGTGNLADQLARDEPRLKVLHRPRKLGLGSAYVSGFRWGLERGYQRFFEMDADFSHDPSYLPAFCAELDAGADVVVGSRNVPGGAVRGWGPLRHAISRGGSLYSRMMLGVPVRDLTTGFKAYTRRALEAIELEQVRSNGYAFQVETTFRAQRAGLRVVEVPILFVDRRAGKSKMTLRDIFEAVVRVPVMRVNSSRRRGQR